VVINIPGESTLHVSGTVIMAPFGEGSPYWASFNFEGRYVIRTVDFTPPRIRRNDFRTQGSAIFCAGLMSAVTFAAALHSPTNDMMVAGAVDRRAYPITPARFLSLACASATEASVEATRAQVLILRTFRQQLCNLLTTSGFEPVTRQG
jgi:hypothetical protein